MPAATEARVLTDLHGLRRTYQKTRCRCPACTDANTQYSARYREARRSGRPVLGAHVAGQEATRIVVALVEEGYLKREIAAWLGHRGPSLQFHAGAGVTVRTVLRLRAIQRRVCS